MTHFIKFLVVRDGQLVIRNVDNVIQLPCTVADVQGGKDFRDSIIGAIRKGLKATITYDDLSFVGTQIRYNTNSLIHVYRIRLKMGHGRIEGDCQWFSMDNAIAELNPDDSAIVMAYSRGCNHSFRYGIDEGCMQNLV